MNGTKNMIYKALLVTMALGLHMIEKSIPVPFMTPGAKLGLANLVTVLALYTLKQKREVIEVISVRVLLSAFLGGSLSALMYSSAGAVFSFIVMLVIKEALKEQVSPIGVSSAGAVFHHIGQLIVAGLIVKNSGVVLYLPFLAITGIITGVFVGMGANYCLPYLKKRQTW